MTRTYISMTVNHITVNTGGTVSAKKLSLKSLALSGLFGAKWFGANCTTGVCQNEIRVVGKGSWKERRVGKSVDRKSVDGKLLF